MNATSESDIFINQADYVRTNSVLNASVCYVGNIDSEYEEDGELPNMGEHDMYLESAMYGDPLVAHCLATGAEVSPDDKEPNTIKQAYALPD